MKHTMANPCEHCPFRNDIKGYLRGDRVREIAESLFRGASFPCHKTTEAWDDDGDMHESENSQQCAGAEIFLAKQGMSTQMGRIAERLGMKVAKVNMKSPVCCSVDEMLDIHEGVDRETGETCSVVNADCEAPAGYMIGGGVVPGDSFAQFVCCECGEPVCGACSKQKGKSKKKRVCNNCLDED